MNLVLLLLLGGADLSAGMTEKIAAFQDLSLAEGQAVAVTDLVIDYGPLKLTLTKGWLYPSEKIEDKTHAGYFRGEATFSYKPTDLVELQQLRNQSRLLARAVDELNLSLSDIFIRSTSDIIPKFGEVTAITEPESFDLEPWNQLKTMVKGRFADQACHFLARSLDPDNFGDDTLFVFDTPNYGQLVLRDSDWDRREVSLTSFTRHKRPETRTWAEYDRANEHSSAIMKAVEDKGLIHITNYEMTLSIPKSLNFEAQLVMDILVRVDALKGVALDLIGGDSGPGPIMKIDQLMLVDADGNGTPLAFVHSDAKLFLRPDTPWKSGTIYRVELSYSAKNVADTVKAGSEIVSLLNSVPWFPRYGYRSRYTFDWKVGAEKPYVPVTSGSTVSRWDEYRYNWVHSKEEQEVGLASVILGDYSIKSDTSSLPHIHAFTSHADRRKQDELLGLSRGIIRYYENLFGKYPLEELNVVQMFPGLGFSEAPPGLTQVTGEAFWSKTNQSSMGGRAATFLQAFLAHEIAHQWWAHKLGANAPEAAWFIEAMASYSAMCFMQKWKGKRGVELEMEGWTNFIRRDYSNDRRRNLGPVAMGEHRLGRSALGAWFGKGPRVLHSLRHQMGANDFFGSLRSLADAYAFQNITTYHFLIAFNRQTGKEWGPFFDDFLLSKGGNPKVRYTVRQIQEGEDWYAEFEFKAQDVLTSVSATVPVTFQLEDRTRFSARLAVQGEGNSSRIKIPQKASKIEINSENEVYISFVKI